MNPEHRDGTTQERPAPPHDLDLQGLPQVRLRLDALALEEGPFCTSAGEPSEALITSIRTVGLINPPLVCRDGEGGWEVVAGFRRLRALRALGRSSCCARDLTGTSLSGLERLLLGLHDNLATRTPNDLEKALALSRLSAFVDREILLRDYMPLLGLGRRDDLLTACLALAEAEPPVRTAVAEGRLSLQAYQGLRPWEPPDRAAAVRCITSLNINFNKQLQFIDLLNDLMVIEGCGAEDLLGGGPPIRALLEQARANPPQAAARLLEHLRRRRLPALAGAERAFRDRVEGLGLSRNVRVIPPPGFEGPVFRLEIAFRSGSELRDELIRLGRTPGIEALGPPWEEEEEA